MGVVGRSVKRRTGAKQGSKVDGGETDVGVVMKKI